MRNRQGKLLPSREAAFQARKTSVQAHLIHATLGYAQSGTYDQRISITEEPTETGDVVANHDAGNVSNQDLAPNHKPPVDSGSYSRPDDMAKSL
jgi:hypothetical protein